MARVPLGRRDERSRHGARSRDAPRPRFPRRRGPRAPAHRARRRSHLLRRARHDASPEARAGRRRGRDGRRSAHVRGMDLLVTATHFVILGAALALDATFGEWPAKLHPVVWMGKIIALFERIAP